MDLAASTPFGTMSQVDGPEARLIKLHLRDRHLPENIFMPNIEHFCIGDQAVGSFVCVLLAGCLNKNFVIVH